MGKKIQIDVITDTVCPWCFIGKRRLEKGIVIAKERGIELDVEFGVLINCIRLKQSDLRSCSPTHSLTLTTLRISTFQIDNYTKRI
ncbi:hypothetical protein M427DRAFT_54664 [Gonapodya prolifera JEL478]|uniref:DSBA-like thioredoxin domain-containing protein n=1 Tax=Gonapodya prolifera (strain JEL478) TaxID=1344416 RepID=A0A139AKT2_GONPJ|nr:hypothetical protein M427DRAFT_54664 [Gonapodya prolifera JEL478]|eukprot:KXS17380.1 hypothetical protein M427DRAFT_54664 [Gonapodya prolifera JEL478]